MSSQSENPPAEDADEHAAGAGGPWAPEEERRVSAWQAARRRREHERERGRGRRRRKQGRRRRWWVPDKAEEAMGGARDSGDQWATG